MSDPDYQRVFLGISSPANIWNMSYDKNDEEESISNYCTLYSENICFVISNLWNEKERDIDIDYFVTGCILCVIPHIREDVLNNSNENIGNKVNTVIKTLFADSYENCSKKPLIRFGLNMLILIVTMVLLTVTYLYGVVKIFVMLIFIFGIRNTLNHAPKFLVLWLGG